jgi:LysR family tcuABC transcriptional regulator
VTIPVSDVAARRENLLASLSDDELSPAALAARVVVADVALALAASGRWPGATAVRPAAAAGCDGPATPAL